MVLPTTTTVKMLVKMSFPSRARTEEQDHGSSKDICYISYPALHSYLAIKLRDCMCETNDAFTFFSFFQSQKRTRRKPKANFFMTRWWWKLLGPNLQKSACQRKGKYLGKDRESELGKKKRGSNWKIRLLRQCISVRFSLLKCSKVSIDRIHGKVEENCYVFYEIRRLHCQIMRESSRGSETWPLPPPRKTRFLLTKARLHYFMHLIF